MSDQFTEALDQTEETQETYANQLGIKPEKIPFTAETLPDAGIAVRTNQDLLNEVASHILNRAGHISIIDERGAGKSHFRDLVYDALSEGPSERGVSSRSHTRSRVHHNPSFLYASS